MSEPVFNKNCVQCKRYVRFLKELRTQYPDYYNLPVPAFGVTNPDLVIIGLAPGKHGANATGRPFTGDHAGIILYETLYRFGFSNQAESNHIKDGLKLINCRITNAVKCVPPQNKPVASEISNCNAYLIAEISQFKKNTVIIGLGLIAHKAVIKAFGVKQSDYIFKHNAVHKFDSGHVLIDSYHCSRYNTNTKRLTQKMFDKVFAKAQKYINKLNLK